MRNAGDLIRTMTVIAHVRQHRDALPDAESTACSDEEQVAGSVIVDLHECGRDFVRYGGHVNWRRARLRVAFRADSIMLGVHIDERTS